jgi:hypothetical protein
LASSAVKGGDKNHSESRTSPGGGSDVGKTSWADERVVVEEESH